MSVINYYLSIILNHVYVVFSCLKPIYKISYNPINNHHMFNSSDPSLHGMNNDIVNYVIMNKYNHIMYKLIIAESTS